MIRDKVEPIIVICLGIFFLLQAYQIEVGQDALVGPRLVPVCIAGMIIGFGILLFIVAWVVGRTENVKPGDSSLSPEDNRGIAALWAAPISKIMFILVIGFAYVWLFSATGYLIATALILTLLLFLFGTRNLGMLAIITVSGTAGYYFIFIYLIGIYAPPGWLINLEMLGF